MVIAAVGAIAHSGVPADGGICRGQHNGNARRCGRLARGERAVLSEQRHKIARAQRQQGKQR